MIRSIVDSCYIIFQIAKQCAKQEDIIVSVFGKIKTGLEEAIAYERGALEVTPHGLSGSTRSILKDGQNSAGEDSEGSEIPETTGSSFSA